jgi:hypothetical protein
MLTIALDAETINNLNLTPATYVLEPLVQSQTLVDYEQQLHFAIDYPRDPQDPRELSEIPEVRLWFIRLDAHYPWLPFLLDWKAGELARYAAMLIPHQFHPRDGIQYNPEALEIFVMQRVFLLLSWLKQQGLEGKSRVQGMAQMFGYSLEDEFFALLS